SGLAVSCAPLHLAKLGFPAIGARLKVATNGHPACGLLLPSKKFLTCRSRRSRWKMVLLAHNLPTTNFGFPAAMSIKTLITTGVLVIGPSPVPTGFGFQPTMPGLQLATSSSKVTGITNLLAAAAYLRPFISRSPSTLSPLSSLHPP